MVTVHDAARRSDVEALRRLLDDDPGLVEKEEWQGTGNTPLHSACRMGSFEAMGLLLERGADINYRGRYGETPLIRACEGGWVGLVSHLLERGADPNLDLLGGWTPMMSASFGADRPGADHVSVLRLLLKDGRVAVNTRCASRTTAFGVAIGNGHADRARVLLLEGGAEHDIADVERETPVQRARRRGHSECVQLIQWWEGELERAYLLSKARAVVDATDSIRHAPEKVGVKTQAEAQRAREEAAPAYLKGRVERGEALPEVEVVRRRRQQQERQAVCEFVVTMLKHDLYVELMQGLRVPVGRRW